MNNHPQSHQKPERIIREPECNQITGLCRTTRWKMEKEGKFPARRQVGSRSIGWLLSEIIEWQRNCVKVE